MNVDALATNPANLKRGKGQAFELGYLRNPLTSSNNFFVGSCDPNSASGIAGGMTYAYEAGSLAEGGDFNRTEWRTGLAVGTQSDVAGIMLGLSGRRLTLERSPKGAKTTEHSDWTGDVGLTIALTGGLILSTVLRDALEIDEMGIKRRIAAGIGYGHKNFIVEANGAWELGGENPVYRAGLLVPIADVAIIRAGYIHDRWINPGKIRHSATLGASFSFGSARLDAGGEMNVQEPSEIRFGLSLVYFLPYAS